jgi:RimJ/RimL family protein N-acetyltransferase
MPRRSTSSIRPEKRRLLLWLASRMPALEIRWWVDPRWWGRGFATEAARALYDEAFTDVGAERS